MVKGAKDASLSIAFYISGTGLLSCFHGYGASWWGEMQQQWTARELFWTQLAEILQPQCVTQHAVAAVAPGTACGRWAHGRGEPAWARAVRPGTRGRRNRDLSPVSAHVSGGCGHGYSLYGDTATKQAVSVPEGKVVKWFNIQHSQTQ